jgi:hypothetical protein
LAERVRREAGNDEQAQIRRAFALVLQRSPITSEVEFARQLLADQSARAATEGAREPRRVALQSFCRALFNVNEMIYVD